MTSYENPLLVMYEEWHFQFYIPVTLEYYLFQASMDYDCKSTSIPWLLLYNVTLSIKVNWTKDILHTASIFWFIIAGVYWRSNNQNY